MRGEPARGANTLQPSFRENVRTKVRPLAIRRRIFSRSIRRKAAPLPPIARQSQFPPNLPPTAMSERLSTITSLLPAAVHSADGWSAVLQSVLQAFDCQTGTLHRLNPDTNLLEMLAQRGIPDFLQDRIQSIPVGKGIAGCAAQRAEPVQMCNLQTDTSGVARPDAKQTKVEGALAVPIFRGAKVAGVLGIGKMQPYDFSQQEISDLQGTADAISGIL
jgi:signal transduction protein with GAF and PtsI domain